MIEGTAPAKKITEKERLAQEEASKRIADPLYDIRIVENDKDEDIQCDVCLELEYEDDDMIVICEMCNAAVHQTCNGGDILERLPLGAWFCERC